MPDTIITAVLAAVSMVVCALLYYKVDKRLKRAQSGEIESKTLRSLWAQIRDLLTRMKTLETKVTLLEADNRRLRQVIRRLWSIIVDNGLSTDKDLADQVAKALENSHRA